MVSIEFCKKCGNLLIAEKRSGRYGWYCRRCNKFSSDDKAKTTALSEKIRDEDEKIKVVNPEDEYLQYPVTDVHCDKCHNNKAYWVLQQTRGGDEPQTKFFCCTKCKNKWREY
ncbi:MAG: transcription factor S [Candidatus Aenigmarchaeota archaeon CG_4_10_14_0_8_um_filter_37_24]|nr:MAG: transcription factor S [Candidatus Aenigmarchaeota archaeon CG_4_8_14_3_um_filter_37_24]PIZ34497.1 MAG: transcription factor S [Candidatus Aenigmarchaeota archaeon CG_4_10_14_0_8_um_filter_37_24]